MTAYIDPTREDISIARNNRKTARTAIFCKDAQGRFLSCNPVYQQFIGDPARFQFISRPEKVAELWQNFHP